MKITKKQFELFEAEVIKWLERFGLNDWSVFFEFKKMEDSRACCTFNCVGAIATFTLNTSWNELDKSFTADKFVRRTAFHEVCELLLARLGSMVYQRFNLNEDNVEEETHRIIRTLENTVWEKDERGL